MRRLARAGDEVQVDAGSVLLNEDAIGYWFVAVLEGSAVLRRGGRDVGAVAAGGHVGDVAILGFGPQPATAVAASDRVRLFVIGRRNVLDLVHVLPGLRAGLMPGGEGAGGESFDGYVRRLRGEGAEAWRQLPPSRHPAAVAATRSAELRFTRPVGGVRRVAGVFSALARSVRILGSSAPEDPHRTGEATAAPAVAVRERLSTRARLIVAGVFAAALVVVAGTYHPPLLVVRASEPIDVGVGLSVAGADTTPLTGSYLLTAVDVRQPTFGGAVAAFLSGDELVGAAPGADAGDAAKAARRLGEQQFNDSRQRALASVAARVGIDVASLHVDFDDHHLSGPSAGLVYALALADLLDPADLAAGRTIAATGSLEDDGRISPVGFVAVKGAAARRGSADVFLVPSGLAAYVNDRDVHAVDVRSLDEAIRYLTG